MDSNDDEINNCHELCAYIRKDFLSRNLYTVKYKFNRVAKKLNCKYNSEIHAGKMMVEC